MRYLHILLFVVYLIAGPLLAQADFPECAYSSSDPDGDRFGYEDGTCRITENSDPVGIFISGNTCIDDNLDGWGWNGRESCRVPIVQTDCIDTAPVGDGWGWDGSTSCRVFPIVDSFNEIDEIESHFREHPDLGFAAAISCEAGPAPFSEITYYLYYDGSLLTDDRIFFGTWGTGVSLVDGTISLAYLSNFIPNPSKSGFTRTLLIDGDRIVRGRPLTFGGRTLFCDWVEP